MYSVNDTLAGGLPHSDIHGSTPARGSPWLFAACHVLHRLLVPRHPPNALMILDTVSRFVRSATTMHGNHRQTFFSVFPLKPSGMIPSSFFSTKQFTNASEHSPTRRWGASYFPQRGCGPQKIAALPVRHSSDDGAFATRIQ